jgi:hypothetical protein
MLFSARSTDVFIVYTGSQAYPMYIITYVYPGAFCFLFRTAVSSVCILTVMLFFLCVDCMCSAEAPWAQDRPIYRVCCRCAFVRDRRRARRAFEVDRCAETARS